MTGEATAIRPSATTREESILAAAKEKHISSNKDPAQPKVKEN